VPQPRGGPAREISRSLLAPFCGERLPEISCPVPSGAGGCLAQEGVGSRNVGSGVSRPHTNKVPCRYQAEPSSRSGCGGLGRSCFFVGSLHSTLLAICFDLGRSLDDGLTAAFHPPHFSDIDDRIYGSICSAAPAPAARHRAARVEFSSWTGLIYCRGSSCCCVASSSDGAAVSLKLDLQGAGWRFD
jgi:hypothetical protein